MRIQSLTTPATFIVSALVLPISRKTAQLREKAATAFAMKMLNPGSRRHHGRNERREAGSNACGVGTVLCGVNESNVRTMRGLHVWGRPAPWPSSQTLSSCLLNSSGASMTHLRSGNGHALAVSACNRAHFRTVWATLCQASARQAQSSSKSTWTEAGGSCTQSLRGVTAVDIRSGASGAPRQEEEDEAARRNVVHGRNRV